MVFKKVKLCCCWQFRATSVCASGGFEDPNERRWMAIDAKKSLRTIQKSSTPPYFVAPVLVTPLFPSKLLRSNNTLLFSTMLMNYHEMTMNEPRDSPARKQQYLVICTIMAGAFVYSVLQAGGLVPVDITQGKFPGGKFVYKYTQRDYAAAGSLNEHVTKDAELRLNNETYNNIYALYLDDPNLLGGRRQRFACGLMATSANSKADIADRQAKLLASNVGRVPPTKAELEDDGAFTLWPKLEYKQTTFPATKALVVQFPFTNGFVSAMILGWRILPPLRQAALDAGAAVPVVISTCSIKESMCTHYAPLGKDATKFLLGLPDTTTYVASLPEESTIDFPAAVAKMGRRISKYFDGWFPSKKEDADEL